MPDVSRLAGYYDGDMTYVHATQQFVARINELETRRRLSNKSVDSRVGDKLMQDLYAAMELSKDTVNEASDVLKERLANLSKTMQ